MSKPPAGWTDVEIGQLADISSGSSPPRVTGETIVMGANGPIGWTSAANFVGGILVGRVGAAGAVHLVSDPCWASDNVLTVVPRLEQLDLKFLTYLLAWSRLNEMSTKTAQPLITQSQLRKLTLTIPQRIEEQRGVAAVLGAMDEEIRSTERLIAKLEQAKQGLLHDLFAPCADLGSPPYGWTISSLGQMSKYITYGFTNPMPTTNDGPWLLTAADINYGYVDFGRARHTSATAFSRKLTNKSRPQPGDILITKDGTLGRVAKLKVSGVCVNQSVAVVRPTEASWSDYMETYLLSPMGQGSMLSDSGGSTIKHLYISKLAKLPIPLPPREEALRIVEVTKQWELVQRFDSGRLTKLRLLKEGLMVDLLTGRMRVGTSA